MFATWKKIAGVPSRDLPDDATALSYVASDQTVLSGYKISCCASRPGSRKGYLLFIQGDATLASSILRELMPFTELGLDIFVYDFRGYGLSRGATHFSSLISDYREIIRHLNAQPYSYQVMYGASLGGVILTDAVGTLTSSADAVIIDSSPSTLPFFCSRHLNPVANLPADCARFLLISGGRDKVVRPKQMQRLIELAAHRHATILSDPSLGHPFMDGQDPKRFQEAIAFLRRFLG